MSKNAAYLKRKQAKATARRRAARLATKKQAQAEARARFDAAVQAGQENARLHPKPTQAELIANPEKYGAVQTAGFDSAIDRFVRDDLEKVFPQLASLPEEVNKPWRERAAYELYFLYQFIFPIWEQRRISSALLVPIFDGFKLHYMDRLRKETGCHCCIGHLSECGFTYESDGEIHHSIGRWEDACKYCRQHAWADTTVQMVLTVCSL